MLSETLGWLPKQENSEKNEFNEEKGKEILRNMIKRCILRNRTKEVDWIEGKFGPEVNDFHVAKHSVQEMADEGDFIVYIKNNEGEEAEFVVNKDDKRLSGELKDYGKISEEEMQCIEKLSQQR